MKRRERVLAILECEEENILRHQKFKLIEEEHKEEQGENAMLQLEINFELETLKSKLPLAENNPELNARIQARIKSALQFEESTLNEVDSEMEVYNDLQRRHKDEQEKSANTMKWMTEELTAMDELMDEELGKYVSHYN